MCMNGNIVNKVNLYWVASYFACNKYRKKDYFFSFNTTHIYIVFFHVHAISYFFVCFHFFLDIPGGGQFFQTLACHRLINLRSGLVLRFYSRPLCCAFMFIILVPICGLQSLTSQSIHSNTPHLQCC